MQRGTTMIQERGRGCSPRDLAASAATTKTARAGCDVRVGSKSKPVSNADATRACVRRAGDRHQQRHDQLLRRSKEGSAVQVKRADLRGRLRRPGQPDRGHRSGHCQRGDRNATSNLDNVVPIVPNGAGSLAAARRGEQQVAVLHPLCRGARYGHVRFRVKNLKAGEVRKHHDPHSDDYARGAGARRSRPTLRDRNERHPGEPIDDKQRDDATAELQADRPPRAGDGRWVVIKLAETSHGRNRESTGGRLGMFAADFVGLGRSTRTRCKARKVDAEHRPCDGSIERGDEAHQGPSDSFPGRQPAAGDADESLAYFCVAASRRDPREVRGDVEPGTGQPLPPGRPGPLDPAKKLRVPGGDPADAKLHTAEIEVLAAKGPRPTGRSSRPA